MTKKRGNQLNLNYKADFFLLARGLLYPPSKRHLLLLLPLFCLFTTIAIGNSQSQKNTLEKGRSEEEKAAKGAQLFREKGCIACHQILGKGGTLGPGLDQVAQRRSADSIREKIRNPQKDNPNSVMPVFDLSSEELEALVSFLISPTKAKPPSAKEEGFVGSAVCIACHKDPAQTFNRTVHSEILLQAHSSNSKGCETCHGPGRQHAESGGKKELIQNPALFSPRKNTELCLPCHKGVIQASGWKASAHFKEGLTCNSCHLIMQQKAPKLLKQGINNLCLTCHPRVRAEFRAHSHHPLFEGRMVCTDCHDPHHGTYDGLLKAEVNSLCVDCHADKRGPFLFEHPAIGGGFTEGCLACHNPHGSAPTKLKRFADRGLCLQCHTDRVNHFPPNRNPRWRTCWEAEGCHRFIHGSNKDPLFTE